MMVQLSKNLPCILCFLAAFTLGILGKDIPCGLFVLSGLVVLFISNTDKFSNFKIANISATIKQAENTITELQALATELCSVSLWSLNARRFISANFDEQEELFFNSHINILKQLNIPADKIKEIEDRWHDYIKYSYTISIMEIFNNIGQSMASKGQFNYATFNEDRNNFFNLTFTPASIEDINAFLRNYELENECVKEYVDAYKYYLEHNKHKSDELWRKRERWKRN